MSDYTTMDMDMGTDASSMTVADLDQNGTADSYVADLDGNGLVDMVETDTDGDMYTDTAVLDSDADGVADALIADTDGDLVADTVAVVTAETTDPTPTADLYEVGYSPSDPNLAGSDTVQSAAYTSGTADLYDIPSSTESTIAMVNQSMSDVGVLSRDAMNPGSESSEDVATATENASNAAQNAQMLEGYIHQQEVSNDIAERDLVQSSIDESRRVEMNAWQTSMEAESVLNEDY